MLKFGLITFPLTTKHLCCGGVLCSVSRGQMPSENIKVHCLLCRSIYNVRLKLYLIVKLKLRPRYLFADIT
jgi:hypothetical protein